MRVVWWLVLWWLVRWGIQCTRLLAKLPNQLYRSACLPGGRIEVFTYILRPLFAWGRLLDRIHSRTFLPSGLADASFGTSTANFHADREPHGFDAKQQNAAPGECSFG